MRSRAFWIKSYLLLILVGILFIKVVIPAFTSADYVQMPGGSQKQVEGWKNELESNELEKKKDDLEKKRNESEKKKNELEKK